MNPRTIVQAAPSPPRQLESDGDEFVELVLVQNEWADSTGDIGTARRLGRLPEYTAVDRLTALAREGWHLVATAAEGISTRYYLLRRRGP